MASEYKPHRLFSLAAAGAAGFAATLAQILILRELLVFFFGNELCVGFALAGWLVWNAVGSRWAAACEWRTIDPAELLGLLLIGLAVMTPMTMVLVRAAGLIFAVPIGESPSFAKMLAISFGAGILVCPFSGAIFAASWAMFFSRDEQRSPLSPVAIYLAEAGSSAVGGLVFFFVWLPRLTSFASAVLTAAVLIAVAGWILAPWRFAGRRLTVNIIWFVTVGGLAAVFSLIGRIDDQTRLWQWGDGFMAVRDTAYHNVAIAGSAGQVSVFVNGAWSFSLPDRQSAEYGVHPVMLQHPCPRQVLLIGGGVGGQIRELLKHPGIERVDYVTPDPALIQFVHPYLPPAVRASLADDRVRCYFQDARLFLKNRGNRYDLILMNVGDPISAAINRFYTREFYLEIRQHLAEGGLFSFEVSGGKEMLGPVQARFLASFRQTLGQVFGGVGILPGDRNRFVAGEKSIVLSAGEGILLERIVARKLKLAYIRPDTLSEMFDPMRTGYLKELLDQIEGGPINRDLAPACYANYMMLWGTQRHRLSHRIFEALERFGIGGVWGAMMIVGGLMWYFFRTASRQGRRRAVALCVGTTGATVMAIQLILLLTFQIIAGFLYRQLALIIAFFMAGLAVGAGMAIFRQGREGHGGGSDFRRLLFLQLCVCGSPLLFLFVLFALRASWAAPVSAVYSGWMFTMMAFGMGVTGGCHFAQAVSVTTRVGGETARIGGRLYAVDLLGAAAGVSAAALFVVPLFGVVHCLLLFSAVSLLGLVALLSSA